MMFEEINEILYYYDPVGLAALYCPEDEYEPEAGSIVNHLRDVKDATELRWMIYEVFASWFDASYILPSSHKHYRYMAEEIWELWQKVIAESEAEAKGGAKQAKKKTVKTYKETFNEAVSEILYQHDPLTLVKFGVPDDEYSSEAADIILHLQYASDVRSLKWLIYEVFLKYFSKETIAAYGDERYQRIAEKIWDLWQKVIEESEAEAKQKEK